MLLCEIQGLNNPINQEGWCSMRAEVSFEVGFVKGNKITTPKQRTGNSQLTRMLRESKPSFSWRFP